MTAAAAERLSLPPGRAPAEELARYKRFLKLETHRLKMLHRAGAGGREICHARAMVIDLLHRYLLDAIAAIFPASTASGPSWRLAVVALGGYGRAELNPHSDIDIMLLHTGDSVMVSRGKLPPLLATLTGPGGLVYTLNDIGLKVGHASRNIEECVRNANSNMQSKTALIEARLIWGDAALFDKMADSVRGRCVLGFEEAYIAARREDQAARRAKYGNSATMQEPNVKNGCGGLRDYQNLLWMAFFKYRVRSLKELEERQQLSETERKRLETAYDFLLRVRNELHYQTNRAMDVLSKTLQPQVALALGYTGRSPVSRIERFMREFYGHTRNIYLITRTLEQRLALSPKSALASTWRKLMHRTEQEPLDGIRFVSGELRAANQRIFRDQPRRLMRVFFHMQQRGLSLHPELVQLIRGELSLVDKQFLRDPHVHQTFLEMLNQRGNVAHILRVMHEVGFLGKYIPEFGDLTCLVQHEFYHQYTADEHTLVCLEKLDHIWHAVEPPFNHYTEIFQNLERPYVLYLALLLHDAGKAQDSRGHAETGSKLALRVARRLGLDHAVTDSLRVVIENHLLMVETSQRHDLDDPTVIRGFADRIKSQENLVLLMLHTFADSQGTSDQLWNDFKETLLWTLFTKARNLLGAGTEFVRAEAKQRDQLAADVRELLPRGVSEDEFRSHWEQLPARYYQIHTAREIAADMTLVHRFFHLQMSEDEHGLAPVMSWQNEPDRGYASVKVCTWNRTGLFSQIAGSLTAAGMNILSAHIYSRLDGVILDTFYVHDARTGKLPTKEGKEEFERVLQEGLTDGVDFPRLIRRLMRHRPLYQPLEGNRIPTVIRIDNQRSTDRTVIEVETEDRIGLLYSISRALTNLSLDISLAKIITEKGAAIDTFYVTEIGNGQVTDEGRRKQIEQALFAAVTELQAEPVL